MRMKVTPCCEYFFSCAAHQCDVLDGAQHLPAVRGVRLLLPGHQCGHSHPDDMLEHCESMPQDPCPVIAATLHASQRNALNNYLHCRRTS